MRTFDIELTGKTPLIMHRDNIEWSDFMDEWRNVPENKDLSKPGDDRTPAFRWFGCCYHDGNVLGVPSENIMRALMDAGGQVLVPGGKKGKTFKSQTQSGMMCVDPLWTLMTASGNTVSWKDIEALRPIPVFVEHKEAAQSMGFDLLVKRAKISSSKHVRVRPVFGQGWRLRGQIAVWDEQIDQRAIGLIFDHAGRYKGLCDWRPGGRTPGPYGTFDAKIIKA